MSEKKSLFWVLATLIILIFQPIADYIAFNYYQASFSLLRNLLYLAGLICISLIFVSILKTFFKKKSSLMLATAIGLYIMILFNNYAVQDFLQNLLKENYKFRYLILLDFLAVPIVFIISSILTKSKKVHNAFLLGIFGASLVSLAMIKNQDVNNHKFAIKEYTELATVASSSSKKPNVYLIIPDMFVGPEFFNKHSIKPLIVTSELTKRSFKVVENAYSNANATMLSLPQVLSMNYLFEDGDIIKGNKTTDLGKLYQHDNPVIREFKRRGYKFYRFADGMTSQCMGNEDKCIQKISLFKMQDIIFLNRTLIPSTIVHHFWISKGLIPGQMEMNEFVPFLPNANEGPFFLLGHFSLPHPPYRFDEECRALPDPSAFNPTPSGFASRTPQERFNVTKGQILCAEKMLITFIDGILNKDKEAIIIVQADHGIRAFFDPYATDFKDMTQENYNESFNILYAFYGPEALKNYIYDGLSPVNSFRLVFGWLDNKEPELLNHRSFFGKPTEDKMEKVGVYYVLHEWKNNSSEQDVIN